MKKYSIAVLTYNVRHRKTYDTLCLLKSRGYKSVTVYAQPMSYVKKRQPLVQHRPEMIYSIPEPEELCQNLGYDYIEGEFGNTVGFTDNREERVFLLCGANILPKEFISSHRIINAHPGYIPLARGLDSYKWSIYNGLPVGATTHFLGDYVDGGEIIERREIEVLPYDTFHSVAQRLYENEIDMLLGSLDHIDEEHEVIVPTGELFKRMPEEKEQELFCKFEEYKRKRNKNIKYDRRNNEIMTY